MAPNATFPTVRIEASIRVPAGNALWPAFWMLPDDSPDSCSGCGVYGGWAASGEIDIAITRNAALQASLTSCVVYLNPCVPQAAHKPAEL